MRNMGSSYQLRNKTRSDSGIYSDAGSLKATCPPRYPSVSSEKDLCDHSQTVSKAKAGAGTEPGEKEYGSTSHCYSAGTSHCYSAGTSHCYSAGSLKKNEIGGYTDPQLKDDEMAFSDSEDSQSLQDTGLLKKHEDDFRGYDDDQGDVPEVKLHQGIQAADNTTFLNFPRNDSHLMWHPCAVPAKLDTVTENSIFKAYISVTSRCDDLINNLQESAVRYNGLRDSYEKNKKLFYILATVNLTLIVTVILCVPLLLATFRKRDFENGVNNGETELSKHTVSPDTKYNICFNCSDLNRDAGFSLETLIEVSQTNGNCCFKSVISVLKSQYWVNI